MDIKFTIADIDIPRVIAAFKGTWSNIPIDTTTGIPKFTDAQWVKECLKKYIIQVIKNYEEQEAKKAVSVLENIIQ